MKEIERQSLKNALRPWEFLFDFLTTTTKPNGFSFLRSTLGSFFPIFSHSGEKDYFKSFLI